MTITLPPDQIAWLDAHVALGEFTSVEDAARSLIDQSIAQYEAAEYDDMAWAKPLVDEALAEVAQGKVSTREEHDARMEAIVALMKA